MENFGEEELAALEDYKLVEKALRYIEENYKDQPGLDEIARSVNLSKYHFQRVFSRWAGISPSRFLQYITVGHAKKLLQSNLSLSEVSDSVGLSSTGRLHDLFINFEAITPGEYKKSGDGIKIWYGFHSTRFGECFIANTERGICSLDFADENNREELIEVLRKNWFRSSIVMDNEKTKEVAAAVFENMSYGKDCKALRLFLKGTNFQIKVWEALMKIEFGRLVSYKHVASMIGQPTASRAVGSAIGSNPIAYVIPCHRVIRDMGIISSYKWGTARKKAIIGWEAAQLEEK